MNEPSHGISGYRKRHCRCYVCRAAHAAEARRYYHRKKAKALADANGCNRP